MKGERRGWFRLASHLHLPLQETMDRTTSSEFVEWMEWMEQDVDAFHREDFFLAQIALEVRRSFVKNPQNVKLKPFLKKFLPTERNEARKSDETTSKSFWFALAGVK